MRWVPAADIDAWLSVRGFAWMVVGVVCLWLLNLVVMTAVIPEHEARGVAGDMFGASTSLFSGLAFAGLIFTLLIQRRELELQREELAKLRTETAGTREQMELQSNFISQQIFEHTFFRLLDLISDSVEGMSKGARQGRMSGKAALREVVDDFRMSLRVVNHTGATVKSAYRNWFSRHQDLVEPYIATFCELLFFIKNRQTVSDPDGFLKYEHIVRSQLSHSEIRLLTYASFFWNDGGVIGDFLSRSPETHVDAEFQDDISRLRRP